MSVSAVESRLGNIIKRQKPKLYKKDSLENLTLGNIFYKLKNDRRYSSISNNLPEKFDHLISLCNKYRIFSAHPKSEIMTYQDSLSVLALVLSFLT